MSERIIIRKYQTEDTQALAEIYYHTIHLVNSKHYTKEQVDAWAPITSLETEGWAKKFLRTNPFVALINDEIAGFAEFEPDGHIDCFFCHSKWIGHGVGSALMRRMEEEANQKNIARIYAEVSITAKPFFEGQGFTTICEQTVTIGNVQFTNYKMEKLLV